MKKRKLIILYFFLLILVCIIPITANANNHTNLDARVTVIGAGPAGIIVVGLLLDLGIDAQDITWIDPEFNVGRLGKYYTTVPGNSMTQVFVDLINSCNAFQNCNLMSLEALHSCAPDDDYPLNIIIEPLCAITKYLCSHVKTYTSELASLEFADNCWHVGIASQQTLRSHMVILATGSHPKTLDYPCSQQISLDKALDKNTLTQLVTKEDSLAVIGGSHSAILILKYLSEIGVKRIINFYKKPLCYSYEVNGVTYNATDGLKGTAARWAQNVLEKNPPANLIRIYNCADARQAWLPICNKIIYAVGYERNELPTIPAMAADIYEHYDCSSGTIGPRLFGIGIAFPEKIIDQAGSLQLGIGLMDFMEYAQCVVPQWLQTKQGLVFIKQFEELFYITQL